MNVLLIIIVVLFAALTLTGFARGLIPTKHIRLPIIHGLNRLLGLLAGLFLSLLLTWLFFMILRLCGESRLTTLLLPYIEKSAFLSYLYEHNILVVLLAIFL